MDFNNFAEHPPPVDARSSRRPPIPVKIVIAGGFGVGKTTAVRSISDMEPLTTE
ncbi:MAG: ATP-binding protein, partial [Micromonosporaceae bacterium]